MTIALFITCLTETFYPRSGIAVVKVLEHLGHRVVFPQAQTCCGQPMFNNGYHDDARDLARRFIRVFDEFETIVTPSAASESMGSSEHSSATEIRARLLCSVSGAIPSAPRCADGPHAASSHPIPCSTRFKRSRG